MAMHLADYVPKNSGEHNIVTGSTVVLGMEIDGKYTDFANAHVKELSDVDLHLNNGEFDLGKLDFAGLPAVGGTFKVDITGDTENYWFTFHLEIARQSFTNELTAIGKTYGSGADEEGQFHFEQNKTIEFERLGRSVTIDIPLVRMKPQEDGGAGQKAMIWFKDVGIKTAEREMKVNIYLYNSNYNQ